MHPLNWVIVVGWLTYIVVHGIRRSTGTKDIDGYLLANRSLPWWAVGLSVMATQLSAVTMIGTTGQGATDGMRFVQFYFGLPLAMVILGVTLVPFLHGARVYTAYEYLERRFDAKTRSLTAFLFLVSRGMSCGTIIAAPAVVFSAIFGWPLSWCVALIGVPAVLYTIVGGVQAVTWVDVKQMYLIVGALLAVVITLLVQIPVSPNDGAAHRRRGGTTEGVRLLVQPHEHVHVLVGVDRRDVPDAVVLRDRPEPGAALSGGEVGRRSAHVAADQRVLEDPAPGARAARRRAGVRVLSVAQTAAPLQSGVRARRASGTAGGLRRTRAAVQCEHHAHSARDSVHAEALALASKVIGSEAKDVNYIIPRFVIDHLPIGLAGLFIAAVIAAAMNAISGELNSLSTTTAIDFYRRWIRNEASDAHFLTVSRAATGLWGVFAGIVATYAVNLGSLIEVVNRFGSFFYGSILGVFLLCDDTARRRHGCVRRAPRRHGRGGLGELRCAEGVVPLAQLVGAVTVVVVGMLISAFKPHPER